LKSPKLNSSSKIVGLGGTGSGRWCGMRGAFVAAQHGVCGNYAARHCGRRSGNGGECERERHTLTELLYPETRQ
jgi:hypothetical protein